MVFSQVPSMHGSSSAHSSTSETDRIHSLVDQLFNPPSRLENDDTLTGVVDEVIALVADTGERSFFVETFAGPARIGLAFVNI